MRSPACIQDTDRSSSLPKDSERPALRGQEQSPPCGRTKFPAAPATPDSFPARKATKTGKDNKTGIHFTGQRLLPEHRRFRQVSPHFPCPKRHPTLDSPPTHLRRTRIHRQMPPTDNPTTGLLHIKRSPSKIRSGCRRAASFHTTPDLSYRRLCTRPPDRPKFSPQADRPEAPHAASRK